MAQTAREVIYKILGDTSSFVTGYEEAADAMDEFEKKTKKANEVLDEIGKKAAVATAAIAGMAVLLGKAAADFNAALAPIETLIPGQTKRIQELKSAIQDLSMDVGASTDDLAAGAYNIISAYGDAEDTIDKLAVSAKAAQAGMTSTNDAINLLSAVTKAYGDTSAVAQGKVADLAFVTLRNGQTSFPELASSIQRVTSLSATLGVSQEELFAVFSAGTGVIGGAAEVSTKTAGAMAELLKGTDTLNKAFTALGVTTGAELIERFGGFQGALAAIKGYADENSLSITNMFGSIEAGQAALYLTGQGAEKFTADLEAMYDAAGAMETAFDAADTGLNIFNEKLTDVHLNLTVFSQKLGDEVLKSALPFVEALGNITGGLADMDSGTLSTIVSMGKVVLTATAVTAGLVGLQKAILATRLAVMALTGALAANPIGAAIAVAVTAGVALYEISNKIQESKEKAKQAIFEETDALIRQTDAVRNQQDKVDSLAKEYETLTEKADKTYEEMAQQQKLLSELQKIYPDLAQEVLEQAAAQGALTETLKEKNMESMRENRSALEKQVLEIQKEQEKVTKQQTEAQWELNQALENFGAGTDRANMAHEKVTGLIDRYEKLGEKVTEAREKIQALNADIRLQERGLTRSQLGNETVTTNMGREREQEPAVGTGAGTQKAAASAKTQGERLAALDREYAVQKALAEQNGKDVIEIERKHLEERRKMLDDFVKEDAAGIFKNMSEADSVSKSLASRLAGGLGTIQEQVDKTNQALAAIKPAYESVFIEIERQLGAWREINEQADEQAEKEEYISILKAKQNDLIDQYNKIYGSSAQEDIEKAENLKSDISKIQAELNAANSASEKDVVEEIKKEVELRYAVHQITGEEEAEQEYLVLLQAKRNELADKYVTLMKSGTASDAAEADKILGQIDAINDAIGDGAEKAKKTWREALADIVSSMDAAKNTIAGIGGIAADIIGNKADLQAREYAAVLIQIEQEKNERLRELEDELLDMQEAHRMENAEREEEYRQQQYEAQMAQYERGIAELQNALSQETNIEKLRELEKQLEAEKKKKREAQEQKKKDEEDKKREAEQLAREKELTNARNQLEWEYTVNKITTENAAGDAAAKAAQDAAKWQKASTVLQLSLEAAISIAKAAAAYAAWNIPQGIAYTAAAVIAGVQAGVAASTPEPPSYTPQPLPPAPRKLAQGGIFMPSAGGTPILTAAGNPAIVAEAGLPELYLPITPANIDNLLESIGTKTNTSTENQLVYSPVFNIAIDNAGSLSGEDIVNRIKDAERDLLEVVEGAYRRYFVGARQ